MARPTNGYRNAAGNRIPGVTTILSRFKDAGGIIHWAWTEGKEGRDYRETRDGAADAGTLAHALVEAFLNETSVDLSPASEDTVAKAQQAFRSWQTWKDQTGLEVISLEEPLVCECHQFGGTPDAMMRKGDVLAIGDWKASNAVYQDYLMQLAAYKHLWEVNHPDQPIKGGFHLCRFSKDYGDFSHHYYSELDDAWAMFCCLREAYDYDKLLKRRVK